MQDYDAWCPHFDRHEETRKAHGITNPHVYRNANDPNDLVLLFDVADIERAKDFGESQDLRSAMDKAGVIMPATVRIVP